MSHGRKPIISAKHSAAGMAMFLLTYVAAISGFALGTYAKANNSFMLGVAALGLIVGAPFLARLARRLRTKIVLDLPGFLHLLERRSIPLVLHLREFDSDVEEDSWEVESGVVSSWEESLLADLRAYGAVLAVGIPGEALPHGGAYRLYLDDEWKFTVERLMELARVIVFRCGNTPGLTWELEQLTQKDRLVRTVFATSATIDGIQAVYAKLRSLGLPGTDLETKAEASLAKITEVAEGRLDLITSEQLKSLEQVPLTLAGVSSSGTSPLFSPYWVAVRGSIHSCESLERAMELLGVDKTRTGVFDTEKWWQAENVIAALSLAYILLLISLVVLAFVPGMETAFGYVFVATMVLFFLAYVLRP